MTHQDDHFDANEIDAQLECLARGLAQQPATPNARIVQALQQTYEVQAEKERRSLARVGDRFASHIVGNMSRSQEEKPLRSHTIEPFPARYIPRTRRIGAFVQTLAAVLIVGVVVGAFLVLLNSRRSGSGAPELHPGSSGATWCVVSSPNRTGEEGTILNGVAATSASDAWAVGSSNSSAAIIQPVIEHWNGSRWSIVASPHIGGDGGSLSGGVTAVSANDAWAVGWSQLQGQSLIEHWNGSRWSIVASPHIGGVVSSLNGVIALSANDVWAVGFRSVPNPPPGGTQTLIEHWNGTRWSIVASPNPGQAYTQPQLNAITAISANDVWAVGYADDPSQNEKTLIEHWNGSRWSIVASPNPARTGSRFLGVTAISTQDVWAVGVSSSGSGAAQVTLTLIEHWNGSRWSIVASPSPGSTENPLSGVTAISPSNVWAVGGSSNSRSGSTGQTLIEHWNGTQWSIVASPSPWLDSILLGVGRVPHTSTVLAVGVFSNEKSNFFKTLTEFTCK